MKKFYDIITKYGGGAVLAAVTLDGYRRQVLSDDNKQKLDEINKLKDQLDNEQKKLFDEQIAIQMKESSNQVKLTKIKENQKEYENKMHKYQEDKSDYNKNELEQSKAKFQNALENLTKNDLGDTFWKLIDKYYEFLSTLAADKIVALFNILMASLTLSSFFTVLSIMLSEQIINKIKILDKYPKIMKLFKLRNNINKSLNKFYLITHLTIIILTILANIYIFII